MIDDNVDIIHIFMTDWGSIEANESVFCMHEFTRRIWSMQGCLLYTIWHKLILMIGLVSDPLVDSRSTRFWTDILKEFSKAAVLGIVYSKPWGGVLVGRLSCNGIGVRCKCTERYDGVFLVRTEYAKHASFRWRLLAMESQPRCNLRCVRWDVTFDVSMRGMFSKMKRIHWSGNVHIYSNITRLLWGLKGNRYGVFVVVIGEG